MEMNIEEIIKDFKEAIDSITSYGYTTNHSDALNEGIEIMRKYQKIEDIMHKVYSSEQADECLVQRLSEIREVIEDGNNY